VPSWADNADRSVLCNTCKSALVLAAGLTLNIAIANQSTIWHVHRCPVA